MKKFLKTIKPWHIYFFLVTIVIFFVIRLINLNGLPVFVDEAIYIRWAQIMKSEPTLRFLPLQDGKQPLFMWSMIPMFKLLKDPVIAGRVLSVLAGFGTFLGLTTLSFLLFSSIKISLCQACVSRFRYWPTSKPTYRPTMPTTASPSNNLRNDTIRRLNSSRRQREDVGIGS